MQNCNNFVIILLNDNYIIFYGRNLKNNKNVLIIYSGHSGSSSSTTNPLCLSEKFLVFSKISL